jgi:hypothetical protein
VVGQGVEPLLRIASVKLDASMHDET